MIEGRVGYVRVRWQSRGEQIVVQDVTEGEAGRRAGQRLGL